MAEATPRLKMAGITIPAETTNIPFFIIALRESCIGNAPFICFRVPVATPLVGVLSVHYGREPGHPQGASLLTLTRKDGHILIEMIFRRCHHKVQCAANTIDRVALAAAQGDLRSAFTTVAGAEVVNQLGPAVAIERVVVQERGEVIDKVFGRSDFVSIHYALQVYRRCCTSSPCRAAHEQQDR